MDSLAKQLGKPVVERRASPIRKASSMLLLAAVRSRKANLQSVMAPHAMAFLIAVPDSPLGSRVDPKVVHIGIAFRLEPLTNPES